MKKLNKILLSSAILPVAATAFLSLTGCGQSMPEGYVTETEWRTAAFNLMFLAANKPTFYADGWDDHITLSNMDGSIVYRLENLIVNRSIIYAKEKQSDANWYDIFGDNIDYSCHNDIYKIEDVYNSTVPRLFCLYFYNVIRNYESYTFDEYSGQYSWYGTMIEWLIKDVESIIAFDSNKNISLIRLAYTNIDSSGTELDKVDIELHLKYEAKTVDVDPALIQRINRHTLIINGYTENTADMTSMATEDEGFIWKLKYIRNASSNITVTDNGTLVDVFATGANQVTIYKNEEAMDEAEYSISTGKISFNTQLKSTDTVNLFFKPKTYAKAYTVKIN